MPAMNLGAPVAFYGKAPGMRQSAKPSVEQIMANLRAPAHAQSQFAVDDRTIEEIVQHRADVRQRAATVAAAQASGGGLPWGWIIGGGLALVAVVGGVALVRRRRRRR